MRRERGASLVLALMLLVAVTLAVAMSAERTSRVAKERCRAQAEARALFAAQGGVERARWALARDDGYSGEDLAVGGCRVRVSVEALPDAHRVVVTARTPAQPWTDTLRKRVTVTLESRDRGELPRLAEWSE